MTQYPLLDAIAQAAYECALRAGAFRDGEIAAELDIDLSRVAEARKVLQELRLLVSTGYDLLVVPTDPDAAEAELIAPLEQSILRHRKDVAEIHRQLRPLSSIFHRVGSDRRAAGESIRIIDDPIAVWRELNVMRRRCSDELMTSQPGGGRPPQILDAVLDPTLAMLRRGVRMRTLYQHISRTSLATRAFVRHICEAGAEVRTTNELSERLIIYDRKIAFVARERTSDAEPGAAVVTDPTVVGFLCRMFDNTWVGSQPFDARQPASQDSTSDVRTSILRLMAMGLKDEVIARRLGMATRTCRRHISSIMEELGADSRFQAGLEIGRKGLLQPAETDSPDPD